MPRLQRRPSAVAAGHHSTGGSAKAGYSKPVASELGAEATWPYRDCATRSGPASGHSSAGVKGVAAAGGNVM